MAAVAQSLPVPTIDGVPLEPDPDAACLPPRAYLSHEFFAAEMEHVFPRSWVYIGDERELANPGDFITADVGAVPVLVVRSDDGCVRALSNVCTHQACVLKDGRGNTGKTIRCPYHGWVFGLDGTLRSVPMPNDFVAPVDKARLALRDVRLETWKGLMFANVSADAPPLLEYLEAIPKTLAHHDFGELAPQLVVDEVIEVNWKVLVDNFGEDYHCPLVHKETLCATFLPQQMVGQEWTNSADLYTDERLDPKAAASGLFDVVSPNLIGDTRHRVHVFRVFPEISLIGNPNGEGWIQQYTPLAPASTRVRVWVYKRYPHEGLTEDEEAFIHAFMGEDFRVSARIQKGLASPLYPGPGPIHRLQKPAQIFRKKLLGILRDAVAPAA